MPQSSVRSVRRVIVLLHGIRTTAVWQELVLKELAGLSNTVAIPIRYGYFDVVRFLLPGPTRRRPIERVARELRSIQKTYRSARISVIAHSFGTYVISRILAEEPDIELEQVLLCGSIVPSNYRWDLVRARLRQRPINDCGTKDVWPVFAASTTWGYGPSGTLGFGSAEVVDRFHPFAHSDFFDVQFVRQYWRSIFETGSVARPPSEGTRADPPWWFGVLVAYPLRIVLPVLTLAVIGSVVAYTRHYQPTSASPVVLVRTYRFAGPFVLGRSDHVGSPTYMKYFVTPAVEVTGLPVNKSVRIRLVRFSAEAWDETTDPFGFDSEVLISNVARPPLQARDASGDDLNTIMDSVNSTKRVHYITTTGAEGRVPRYNQPLVWNYTYSADPADKRVRFVDPVPIQTGKDPLKLQLFCWTLTGWKDTTFQIQFNNITLNIEFEVLP